MSCACTCKNNCASRQDWSNILRKKMGFIERVNGSGQYWPEFVWEKVGALNSSIVEVKCQSKISHTFSTGLRSGDYEVYSI